MKKIVLLTFLYFSFFAVNSLSAQTLPHQAAISNNLISVSNIYPNPASQIVNVDFILSNEVREAKIIFHNILGSVVGEHKFNIFENKLQVPIHDFRAGIYFYTIAVNEKNLITKKFIVSR